jgi:hypothetical protein
MNVYLYHLTSTSVEVKKAWNFTSTPLALIHGVEHKYGKEVKIIN